MIFKVIVAVVFGLIGFWANFFNIQLFEATSFKINILLGLLFPLLIAQAWGWRYGLLSALAGGCQTMWWLWRTDGYGFLYAVPVFTIWVVWHGYWANRRRSADQRRWYHSALVVEIPFRIISELGFYTIFRWLVSLNPPPWNPSITWNYVPLSWVNTVAVKQTITAYLLLVAARVLLSFAPVRRFFRLKKQAGEQLIGAIYAGALLMGVLLWGVDGVVEYLAFNPQGQSFWDAAILNVNPHDLFMRNMYILVSVITGVFFSRLVTERMRAQEALRKKTADLTLINSLNNAINQGDSLQEIVTSLSEGTKQMFSSHGATVYFISDDQEYLVMQNFILPSVIIQDLEKLIDIKIPAVKIPLNTESLYLETLQTGRARLIHDPAVIQGLITEFTLAASLPAKLSQRMRKLVPQIYKVLGIRSVILVPMVAEDEFIGLLDISSKELFTESDLHRIEAIASQLTTIIQRKQAEEKMRRLRQDWETIFQAISHPTIILDPQHRLIAANHATVEATNTPIEELIGEKCYHIFHGTQAPPLGCPMEVILESSQLETVDREMEALDGHFMVSCTPLFDAQGNLERVIHIATDITERVRAEEKIEHLNLVLRAIRNVNQLIVTENDRGRLLQRACEKLIETRGYFNVWIALFDEDGGLTASAEAGLGEDFFPLVKQFERGELPACGRRALAQTEVESIEDPLSACGDCLLAASCAGRGAMTVRVEHAGNIYGLLSASIPSRLVVDEEEQGLFQEVAGDVAFALHQIELEDARVQAEKALRKSERFLQDIFDGIQGGISVLDSDLNIMRVNAWMERIYASHAPLAGKKCYEVYQQRETPCPWCPSISVLETGEARSEIVPYTSEENLAGWIDLSAYPLKDIAGHVIGVIEHVKDITERVRAEEERRQMEAQLRQAQKLESIGTLAGGVAHEINNPIMGIMNYAQLIGERLDPDQEQLREFSSGIIHETERVAKIVRNLLTFSRQEKRAHSLARMTDIVEDTLTLIRTIIKRDQITLEVAVPEDLPKIQCRSQQIQQVLMNLLTNARDALNQRYPEYDPDKIVSVTVHLFEKDGRRWLRTAVEDHGVGVPVEIRERIFDPFFTTKDRATGTGLGLSISLGIVQDHHGELTFESEEGQPTRFYLDLPVDNGWELEE